MKYYTCHNPSVKALVALKALKGESISYLSVTYHVNRREIIMWKQQLAQELHLEKWMVTFFARQPYILEKKKEEDSLPF
jgi:hypothetical protein